MSEVDTEQPFSWTNEQIEEFERHEGYCLQDLHVAPVTSCQVVAVVDPGPRIKIRPDTRNHKGHVIEVSEPQVDGGSVFTRGMAD